MIYTCSRLSNFKLFSRRVIQPLTSKLKMSAMEVGKTCTAGASEYQRYVCSIVPPLNFDLHKGQCGRIAVVGGSSMFTGAPYFVGFSALRLGADLVYIVTTKEAGPVIKAYSPELMVLPYLNSPEPSKICDFLLPRVHSLVIGPGLELDAVTEGVVTDIIRKAIQANKPIVFDATVFPLLRNNFELITGYKRALLTPNVREFNELYDAAFKVKCPSITPEAVEALAAKLGNLTVVCKGTSDIISDGTTTILSDEEGSPRRCGGQGDILAGLLGTFAGWGIQSQNAGSFSKDCPYSPLVVAALGASMVTRRSAKTVFKKLQRSTLATDMLEEIHDSFNALFPVE